MRLAAVPVVALLLAGLPAAGQETPLPNLFSDVIDVRVVNVEVVVTDRKGNRIRGLEASDFELRVDGEQVPISYFTEIDDGWPRISFDNGRPRTTRDSGAGNVPSLVPEEPVGTNFLIFINDLAAIRKRRDGLLDRLEQDLALLRPADRVAMVAFDGYNVSRLSDWTSSRSEIAAALQQARERKALGLLRHLNLGDVNDQTRRTVLAATGSIRSLANVPGRKVMLLLVEGWAGPTVPFRRPGFYASTEEIFGPLVAAANLAGYTLYPIGVRGFASVLDLDLARSGNVAPSYYPGSSSTYPWRAWTLDAFPFLSATSPWSYERSLRFLADETGGLALVHALRRDAFAIAADDSRTYYSLGFEPKRDQHDALHDIDVRVVGRRGFRIRSRESYVDMSKGTEVTMLVEGALLLGGSPGAETLEVWFGAPEKAGFRKIIVPMEVRIPLDDVTLLRVGSQWMNELEFRFTLINEYGDRSGIPTSKFHVLGSRAPLPGEHYVYEVSIFMRKRKHRYVAAVYDPLSDMILSKSGTIGPRIE